MIKYFIFLVVQIVIFSSTVFSQGYSFKTYTTPAGGHDLTLTGINNIGRMVGNYITSTGESRGIVIYPTGFVQIKIPNGTQVMPRSINNHNEVHGTVGQYGHARGFIVYQNKAIATYDIPNSFLTEGLGLNDQTVRVGDFRSRQDNLYHGFLRISTSKGPVVTQIDYPAAIWTSVSAISNSNMLAGSWFDGDTIHGFYCEAGGQFYALDYPGSRLTSVSAMNNLGEIVGLYCNDNDCHGFSYFQGAFQSVDFPAALYTEPFGVNDSGVIVGSVYIGQQLGFVATPQETP